MTSAGTYFSDISPLGKIRISGTSSHEFIKVMTTVELCRLHAPGLAAPALVLNAEGYILDMVMIYRTGEHEYLLVSHPQTADELFEWLEAHAELVGQDGVAAFEDIKVEDTTSAVGIVALYGPGAQMILEELSKADLSAALASAHLTLITIGQLEVMVARWPFLRAQGQDLPTEGLEGLEGLGQVFEVYLPAGASEDFKQILLGFEEIDPQSFDEYKARRQQAHTWFGAAEDAAYCMPVTDELRALMRQSKDFVGARALKQQGLLPR